MIPANRLAAIALLATLGIGAAAGYAIGRATDSSEAAAATGDLESAGHTLDDDTDDVDEIAITTTTAPATTVPATLPPEPEYIEVVLPVAVVAPAPDAARALELAEGLESLSRPSTCPLPLDTPRLLPNAPREYRSGVHRGIDFMCNAWGFEATAVAPGRIVMAHDGFVDPSTADRDSILDVAADLGRTPTWTLAMLYGRFVIIDHGVIDNVGHVVTIYAHLEEIAAGVVEGAEISQDQLIGSIGNSGTSSGSRGSGEGIHLHWELYVDDVYLAAALSESDTRAVYAELYG